jgi:hypothetical protein
MAALVAMDLRLGTLDLDAWRDCWTKFEFDLKVGWSANFFLVAPDVQEVPDY